MNPLTATLSAKAAGEPLPRWMLAGFGIALAKARKEGSDPRVTHAALELLRTRSGLTARRKR